MANNGSELILLISLFTFFNLGSSSLLETDTLAQGQQLKDSRSDHLVSAGGTFKLGFFSTEASNNRYIGIWYNVQPANTEETKTADTKPVWVDNRNTPLYDKSGILMIDGNGSLKISQSGGNPFVLSSAKTAGNVSATLLDSGNFIVKKLSSDGSTEQIMWQSFDYPTDTLLPDMKLGINLKTGHQWSLNSWISEELPASGSFTLSIDPSGESQFIILRRGLTYWNSGLWMDRSKHFDITKKLSSKSGVKFSYTENENERYFSFSVDKNQKMSAYRITSSGNILEKSRAAPFGKCSLHENGFHNFFYLPSDIGCVPLRGPKCRKNSEIRKKRQENFPKGKVKYNEYYNLSLYDCGAKCIRDCSCVAFASDDQTTICEIWSEGLGSKSYSLPPKRTRQIYSFHEDKYYNITVHVNLALIILGIGTEVCHHRLQVKKPITILNHNVYIRHILIFISFWPCLMQLICAFASGFLSQIRLKVINTRQEDIVDTISLILVSMPISAVILAVSMVPFLFIIYIYRRLKVAEMEVQMLLNELRMERPELQFFSFETMADATNNFAATNKLGEGGFGSVYKGVLHNDQRIAVKRLSSNSGQGLVEFKNEALLIAKLQHTNLVSLKGYCLEEQEKMLIYEYLPNKSLASLNNVLDWIKRYNIIKGVAQGLLYLHEHSRLKVIHRDLKASNILLDHDMNLKISDFGMGRLFRQNEPQANTTRIVGTRYMSPEYVWNGIYSTKSDMFSFGVLLLEILSGRRNNSFSSVSGPLHLAGYAWELWRENRALELIDASLGDSYPSNEAMRCIHVGLLCVQVNPDARPSISGNQLPTPNRPAYCYGIERDAAEVEHDLENRSLNMVTITEMVAR